MSFSNIQILNEDLISISGSNNVSMHNLNVFNFEKEVVNIESSNISLIDNLNIQNCSGAFKIKSSFISGFMNSNFSQNGGVTSFVGGAIKIYDSSVSMSNNLFTNNTAVSGGAVYFTCTSTTLWSLSIQETEFKENTAVKKGGALFYDYRRPEFGHSILFSNNSAQYGPDIASYAVKITFSELSSQQMKLENVGSGIAYEEDLKFVVRDYDNQIMVLDNENQIIINSQNDTLVQVGGFNSGIYSFRHPKYSEFKKRRGNIQ